MLHDNISYCCGSDRFMLITTINAALVRVFYPINHKQLFRVSDLWNTSLGADRQSKHRLNAVWKSPRICKCNIKLALQ
jgi:hypothetical protein